MQRPNRFIILLVICVAGIFFYSGCSSSSNTIRYNTRNEKQSDNNSAVRFSSKDKEPDKDTAVNNDTTSLYSDSDMNESDPDDIPPDTKKINVSELLRKYSATTDKNVSADESDDREKILMEIIKYLDTPYKYGGNTKRGIDCSAFTKSVYEKALSVELERNARQQYHEGEVISGRDDLQFGDLVFFNTRRRVRPGHVGIYIGDHLFAHASSSNGVTVSSLEDTYYSKRYMGARRIINLENGNKLVGHN